MRINKGSLANIILSILETSVDGYVKLEDFTYHTYIYAYYGGRELPKSKLSRALADLRKRGLLEQALSDNKLAVKLTELGYKLSLTQPPIQNIKGGKIWEVVIFDFPETRHHARDIFRNRLKSWGFTQFQKSVWAINSPIYPKLETLINNLKLEDWVYVIETTKISKQPKITRP